MCVCRVYVFVCVRVRVRVYVFVCVLRLCESACKSAYMFPTFLSLPPTHEEGDLKGERLGGSKPWTQDPKS